MSSPRIAVSGVVRTWDGAQRTGANAAYLTSVVAAGGVPAMAARALDAADALLLTGGEDMDPAWYGSEPSPLAHPPSRERDLFELALFAAARQRGIPILGICRGIQVINVAMGGTLYQDLPSERPGPVDHNPPRARTDRSHPVRILAGSRVAAALGRDRVSVNSFHHQAVRDLAPGLLASGWTEDGLIEAVETADGEPWLLAVQWHPEEMHAEARAPEHGLFRALVERAAGSVNPVVPQQAVG
jgi:putative glutamine amidotransferase